ncbi:exodeoxyribonuclease VII large subunit, partial [Candidatus Saccharibacteria bacterium]|nr:exodeoxyribonuclease VII large subunit [Candidatus Saccharibacteria bacterium]
ICKIMNQPIVFSVSDFVVVFNQTIDYAYPIVTIKGELSNFKISKNKWVYFDIKDQQASLRCFGTVYSLSGLLEDGMLINIVGSPRLHQTFGFSINVQSIKPEGEGSIKRGIDLLRSKLDKEGLLGQDRKRALPRTPQRVGLLTSGESAAYTDFIKIINTRWGGLEIIHYETQVQGDTAINQIISGLNRLNQVSNLDVIVVTRGGGSIDDLGVFNNEQVVRAIAASRVPTLVAIGHERDESLSELVADMRASTPSNAAELLTPEKHATVELTYQDIRLCLKKVQNFLDRQFTYFNNTNQSITTSINRHYDLEKKWLNAKNQQIKGYDPKAVLRRGYSVLRHDGALVKSSSQIRPGDTVAIYLDRGSLEATIDKVY